MRAFCEADGFPLYWLEAEARTGSAPRLYFSAGIHGDEPAATEALVAWAGRRAGALGRCGFVIFPCLNPWGLLNNSRCDARGRDLNRGYHRKDLPVIAAQKALLRGLTFDAALMLHEDFDGRGTYIYELPGERPFWGERLLASAAKHIPPEPRARVEGRRCRRGVIRPRAVPANLPGLPEALFLGTRARRSMTFETPSEFSVGARVEAHMAALDELLRLARAGG